MFTETNDILLTLTDARWTRDQILAGSGNHDVLVHYEELQGGGHDSYFIGNDMSYLEKVIDLVKKYNPRPMTEREKSLHSYLKGEDEYEKELDKIFEKYIDSPQEVWFMVIL